MSKSTPDRLDIDVWTTVRCSDPGRTAHANSRAVCRNGGSDAA